MTVGVSACHRLSLLIFSGTSCCLSMFLSHSHPLLATLFDGFTGSAAMFGQNHEHSPQMKEVKCENRMANINQCHHTH